MQTLPRTIATQLASLHSEPTLSTTGLATDDRSDRLSKNEYANSLNAKAEGLRLVSSSSSMARA